MCVGFSMLVFITIMFHLIKYKPDVFKLEFYAILVEFDKFRLGFI
jgi:hypothetical protein